MTDPIRTPFPAKKFEAWHFKIHPYYTKQPSNVVGEYIKHFCPEGGLVVDPFCGSGVTAVEALTNRRKVVVGDLDPLAVFITRMTCLAPVDLNAFWDSYRQVEAELRPIVDFVRKASANELAKYDLKVWYPRGVKLPSNADRGYVEEIFGRAQLITLAHLLTAIGKVKEEQARQLLLFVFSGILARASLTYAIDTKHAGGGDSGIFRLFRYSVLPSPDYRDVWKLFETRARLVARAKEEGNKLFGDFFQEGDTFVVYNDTAENLLSHIREGSADYVYTDPPYGKHITYLDLSTMWHAWLGFNVTDEMRQHEAIENGEQQFDERHYMDVLDRSFAAMFKALKEDAWLSLVYHHKDPNLWYQIQEMFKNIGFKYVNTVAQPLTRQSFHKTKRPLRVLGESLIVNFQKSRGRKIFTPVSLSLAGAIKDAAELAIVRGGGATTEDIMREVVPKLFEANLIIDAASRNMGDILAILEANFDQSDGHWTLKRQHRIGGYIETRDITRYYVVSYLRQKSKATFDDIVTTVLPLLINGHQSTREDILDVLKEVALSLDGKTWELADPSQVGIQVSLPLPTVQGPPQVPATTTHNQHIFRLAVLCQKAGLVACVGKQERNDLALAGVQQLEALSVSGDVTQLKRIEQIDICWADANGKPIWAFEVEESTSILSALERFVSLLAAEPGLGKQRRLTIVAPKSRRRKLYQELVSSSYIGHPLYLENKLTYLFSEELEAAFAKLGSRSNMTLADLERYCQVPPQR
ncbi:MAG: DNA methyltransferase [Chloroflexota bacterium]|nr:DNA methyltransferase [Chloroflexota bacterium]